MKLIEPELYKQIQQAMPIICVDLLIHQDDRFLLLLRRNEPAKGLWWTPGGRLLKDELLVDAAHRKAKEELGIEVILEKQIGIYDQFWKTSVYGVPVHTPDVYYLATLSNSAAILKLDNQHTAWKWFDSLSGLHLYIKQVVKDSGILVGGDE